MEPVEGFDRVWPSDGVLLATKVVMECLYPTLTRMDDQCGTLVSWLSHPNSWHLGRDSPRCLST